MAMTTTETEIADVPGVEIEPDFPPHRMTIDRYERLVESGVYGPRDPVFLWQGRLVEKMTEGDRHAFSSSSLVGFMIRLVPDGWAVRPDKPILLADESVPEPDLTIVRGSLRDYGRRKPGSEDIAIVIEVSDSSLRLDSGAMLKAYAANSILVYWIVNIPVGRVEVFTEPSGPAEVPGYRVRREYGLDDEVPVILDGREVGRISVKEIFL
jgi:Uma2 family endonuclease